MLIHLFKHYWRVSTFKETPENTPYSPVLFALVSFCFLFVMAFQWLLIGHQSKFTLSTSLFAGLIIIASYWIYTYLLLSFFRLSNRTLQTLTCLLAGHTMVRACAFPLLFIAPWLNDANVVNSLVLLVGLLYFAATILLTLWQFMVSVYIYKHAIGLGYFAAVLVGLGLVACNLLFMIFLLGL